MSGTFVSMKNSLVSLTRLIAGPLYEIFGDKDIFVGLDAANYRSLATQTFQKNVERFNDELLVSYQICCDVIGGDSIANDDSVADEVIDCFYRKGKAGVDVIIKLNCRNTRQHYADCAYGHK